METKLDIRVEIKNRYVTCIVSWIAMSVSKAIVGETKDINRGFSCGSSIC